MSFYKRLKRKINESISGHNNDKTDRYKPDGVSGHKSSKADRYKPDGISAAPKSKGAAKCNL